VGIWCAVVFPGCPQRRPSGLPPPTGVVGQRRPIRAVSEGGRESNDRPARASGGLPAASTTNPGCAPRGLPSTRIVRSALRAGRSMKGTMACMARPGLRAGALGLGRRLMPGFPDRGSELGGDLVGRAPPYGAAVSNALRFVVPGCQVDPMRAEPAQPKRKARATVEQPNPP